MNEVKVTPKKNKKRSSSYPAFSLQNAVDATKTLKDQLGDGPYSRNSMAVALGYKGVTGSSAMKISSCVQFGLLDRNGNIYNQSELAKRIFNYIDENEREESIIEAFGKPTLYQKLLSDYSGKSLPLMLESILIRNHGIQENAAKNAASSFKESAEYAGVLKNGVISLNLQNEDSDTVPNVYVRPKITNDIYPAAANESRSINSTNISNGELPVVIPGTRVKIIFPSKYAYHLGVGAFRASIEQLAKDIKEVGIKESDTAQADSPTPEGNEM